MHHRRASVGHARHRESVAEHREEQNLGENGQNVPARTNNTQTHVQHDCNKRPGDMKLIQGRRSGYAIIQNYRCDRNQQNQPQNIDCRLQIKLDVTGRKLKIRQRNKGKFNMGKYLGP
jgi:hypothetical protein